MITSKNDKIYFGKYKGKTVEEVIEKERNAQYILWCQRELNCFNLPKSYMKRVKDVAEDEKEQWRVSYFGDDDGIY
jgi:hypothetical protein